MDWWHDLIGSDPRTITWWQMSVRAAIIFAAGLLLVRFGGKRTFGKTSSFDIVVAVILGSILSRALTGNARLLPTLAAGGVLMGLHLILAKASLGNKKIGHLVKGIETPLVQDGEIQWNSMRQSNMTLHDLREAARLKGVPDVREIQTAYLERNGSVSVFRKPRSERQNHSKPPFRRGRGARHRPSSA